MVYKIWTEKMLDVIRENYNKLSDREIAILLNKTENSIKSARRKYE